MDSEYDMSHVDRVITNENCEICTALSEMWHEPCAQGYQKYDMRQVCGYQ